MEPSDKGFKPPAGPRGANSQPSGRGLEIKGSSNKSRETVDTGRRPSQSTSAKASPTDPHADERARRDRERLLKETQKMASLAGLAGGKRGRDDGEDGRRSRRKGRRGEVVSVEDEEERMRRLEAEREGARWD